MLDRAAWEHPMFRVVVRMTALFAIAVAPAAIIAPAAAQATPKTGTEVLQRMHDAYAGKWYHTLTFVQQTTAYRDGKPTISTWYESLRHTDATGTQLRIDTGDPKIGNGMLYTADSTWVLRAGKLAATRGTGNEFLPMIEGVYVQPVQRTVEQLKTTNIDMSKVTTGRYDDRPVWIVGVASPADTTSPQFWVDTQRKVVVRMIMGIANTGAMDVHLDKYVPLAGGWLATKISMLVGGAPRQTEEYSDWKANVDLTPALFDPATWTTAPHWSKP
jgi:outer membrane lipoprotein-sorting protein